MQTHTIKIFSNQPCFTANMKSRHGNQTGNDSIAHDIECTFKIQWYSIHMLSFISFRHNGFHYYKHQEIKTV